MNGQWGIHSREIKSSQQIITKLREKMELDKPKTKEVQIAHLYHSIPVVDPEQKTKAMSQ